MMQLNTLFFLSCSNGPTFSVPTPTSGVVNISLNQTITQGSTITIENQGNDPPYRIFLGPASGTKALGTIIQTESNLASIIICAVGYPPPGPYCLFNEDQSGAPATCSNVRIVTPTQFPATVTASASSVTSNIFTSPTSSLPRSTSTSPPSVTSSLMGHHISEGQYIRTVVPLGSALGICFILIVLGACYILKPELFRRCRRSNSPRNTVVHNDNIPMQEQGPSVTAPSASPINTNPPSGEPSGTTSTSASNLIPISSTTRNNWFADIFGTTVSRDTVAAALTSSMDSMYQDLFLVLPEGDRNVLLNHTGYDAAKSLFKILDNHQSKKALIESFRQVAKKKIGYLVKEDE